MNLAGVREEHEKSVAVSRDDVLYVILFLGRHADDALSAALLRRVGIRRLTLDVSAVSHRDDTGVALDEILIDDIVLSGDKLGPGADLRISPLSRASRS